MTSANAKSACNIKFPLFLIFPSHTEKV
jgi:hypothetical protein